MFKPMWAYASDMDCDPDLDGEPEPDEVLCDYDNAECRYEGRAPQDCATGTFCAFHAREEGD